MNGVFDGPGAGVAGVSCGTLVLTPAAADELVARLQRPLPAHVWGGLPPKPVTDEEIEAHNRASVRMLAAAIVESEDEPAERKCTCRIEHGMRAPTGRIGLERDCPVHGELPGCTCEWNVSGRGRVLRDPLCSVHVPPKTPAPPPTERQIEPPNAEPWEGEPTP